MVHWGTASCDPPTPKDDNDMYWRSLLIQSAGWVGIPRVTEANVEEWLWRFEFLRRMGSKEAGCRVFERKGDVIFEPITPQILRRWVGLWTNWSDISRHAFVKRQYEDLERMCDSEVRSAIQTLCDLEVKRKVAAKTKKRRVKA
jgi:hypothetical protein